MRRTLAFAALAALAASCVTPEAAPDPRGAIKPGQRLIVMVFQSPGPWIIADADSKAESALKILPLGNFLQGMQEDRVNAMSKEIQPYLPRPHYDQAIEAALIKALKASHNGPVQTAAEAGIAPAQRRDWNAAADQLDWRRKYYFTETSLRAPRDYSKILSLDDAVVLEVNVSFGLEPDDQERTLPLLSATSRLYRADTSHMLWSREERLSDTTSSATLTEFRATPQDLTDRLYALSEPLAARVATDLSRDVRLAGVPYSLSAPSTPAPGVFVNGQPTAASTAPVTAAPPAAPPLAPPSAPWPPASPDPQQPPQKGAFPTR